MRHRQTRRQFAALIATGFGITLLPGCSGSSTSGDREKYKAAALVSVMIGQRIIKLPHPALRITGLVLVLSGTLVIAYLDLEDKEQSETIKVTMDEAIQLHDRGRVTFVRQDDKLEEVAIHEEKPGTSN